MFRSLTAVTVMLIAALFAVRGIGAPDHDAACTGLDIEIERVEAAPSQYARFCTDHPAQCELSGAAAISFDTRTRTLVERVNSEVNREIAVIADRECLGFEEFWSLPEAGYGDCEDIALEKRKRLAEAGIPSAALTMTIVHHPTEFFAHAVLLLETDRGTFVLDNLTDDLLCWHVPRYDYERRERPDGAWTRFVRSPDDR